MSAGGSPEAAITPELLADLQAGLLDDATARRLRERIRHDPDAARMVAGLDRVRRDLAHLGTDAGSAPPVPDDVTARVITALRAAEPPDHVVTPPAKASHAVRGPRPGRPRLWAAIAGTAAAVVGIVVGAAMLVQSPAPTRSAGLTAEQITVERPVREIPLSDAEIVQLADRSPDLGALADPARLASCLAGLGYAADTPVLGARPLNLRSGAPGVLLLLPSERPSTMAVRVVAPTCSSAHTGLLADTVVTRP
ncbi:MAG: hypothetical protein JST91_28355 [Actinobacteria bacterium]|nr:hypothetical protein [Actinomycetota bacterium]